MSKYDNTFNDLLDEQENKIKSSNKSARTDINKRWEKTAAKILNIIYEWNLVDLNSIKNNHPAIDLGDLDNHIGVSVTSRTDRAKFNEDIKKLCENHLNEKYQKIYFFILGRDKKHKPFYYPKIDFSEDHIIDFKKLKKIFSELSEEKQTRIIDIVTNSIKELPRYNLKAAPTHFCQFIPGSRDSEIQAIDNAFKKDTYIFLFGMRGIGKSELAVEWASKNHNSYIISFKTSITETIRKMDFTGYKYTPSKIGMSEREKTKEEFKQRLDIIQDNYRYSTLIIDNFDDDNKTLSEMLNQSDFKELTQLNIRIIFTTRYRATSQGIEVLELKKGFLLALIKKHYQVRTNDEEELLLELIKEVDFHTLTVDLIGKTLNESYGELSPGKLLRLFKDHKYDDISMPKVVTDQNRRDISYENKERRIFDHLKLLFNVAGLNEYGKNVMRHAVLIPEMGMPINIFRNSHENEEREVVNDSIIKRIWLRVDERNTMISIHSIVREVCRVELKPNEDNCRDFIQRFIDEVKRQIENQIDISEPGLRRLEAETLDQSVQIIGDSTGKYNRLCGFCYRSIGNYLQAVIHIDEAVKSVQSIKTNHTIESVCVYNEAGLSYSHAGEQEKAIGYQENALKILNSIEPNNYKMLGKITNDLGVAYSHYAKDSGNAEYYKKAKQCYGQLNEYNSHISNDDNQRYIVRQHNNLGHTLMKEHKYSDAKDEFEAGLKELERIDEGGVFFKKDYEQLYTSLGNVLGKLNRDPDALKYRKQALAIAKEIYDKDDPKIARAERNLANTYRIVGDTDKAIEFYSDAERTYKERIPQNRKDLARCQYDLGKVLYEKVRKGDIAQAEVKTALSHLFDSWNNYKLITGKYDHREKAKVASMIGDLYTRIGQGEEALPYLEEALKVYLDAQYYNYEEVVTRYHHIGEIYYQNNKREETRNAFEQEYLLRIETTPDEHKKISDCCYRLGCCLKDLREYPSALDFLRKALDEAIKNNNDKKMMHKISKTIELTEKEYRNTIKNKQFVRGMRKQC